MCKVSKYEVFSGLYYPTFGLNTELYKVNLRIQFEFRKIRTRKNSVFGHFLRNDREPEKCEIISYFILISCPLAHLLLLSKEAFAKTHCLKGNCAFCIP